MKKPTPMADEPTEQTSIDTRLVRKLADILADPRVHAAYFENVTESALE